MAAQSGYPKGYGIWSSLKLELSHISVLCWSFLIPHVQVILLLLNDKRTRISDHQLRAVSTINSTSWVKDSKECIICICISWYIGKANSAHYSTTLLRWIDWTNLNSIYTIMEIISCLKKLVHPRSYVQQMLTYYIFFFFSPQYCVSYHY